MTPITPGVAGLQEITASNPCRWDYWQNDFFFDGWGALTSAQVLAAVTQIRFLYNDLTYVTITGTTLDNINQYYGAPAFNITTQPFLTVFHRGLGIRGGVQGFDKTALKLYSGSAPDVALETILNTGSFNKAKQAITSFNVQMDIVGAPAATPNVTPTAQVTDYFPGGAGLLKVVSTTNVLSQISTNNQLQKNFGLSFGDIIHNQLYLLFITPITGVLDGFTFYYNNIPVLQRTAAYNQYLQLEDRLRFPNQPVVYAFEWEPNGYGDEFLSIGDQTTDLQLKFADTASESTEIVQISAGYPFGLPDNQ
jgi:hypothetical protein